MSGEFLERLKADRPDVDWDAELAAARERRERALAGPDMTAIARAVNELGTAVMRDLKPLFDYLARVGHAVHRMLFLSLHRRCWTCHPERKPRPLAVDGHEYQRRLRARRKRGRR